MSELKAEVMQLLDTAPEEQLVAVIQFIKNFNLNKKQNWNMVDEEENIPKKKIRLGLAKGKISCPTDFFKEDEEIYQLFGGECEVFD